MSAARNLPLLILLGDVAYARLALAVWTLAEKGRSRTFRPPLGGTAGFEDRSSHRASSFSVDPQRFRNNDTAIATPTAITTVRTAAGGRFRATREPPQLPTIWPAVNTAASGQSTAPCAMK